MAAGGPFGNLPFPGNPFGSTVSDQQTAAAQYANIMNSNLLSWIHTLNQNPALLGQSLSGSQLPSGGQMVGLPFFPFAALPSGDPQSFLNSLSATQVGNFDAIPD